MHRDPHCLDLALASVGAVGSSGVGDDAMDLGASELGLGQTLLAATELPIQILLVAIATPLLSLSGPSHGFSSKGDAEGKRGIWNSGDGGKPRGHGGSSCRGAEDGSGDDGEGRHGCGLVDGICWIGVDFMLSETPVIDGLLDDEACADGRRGLAVEVIA
ncbi:hypothetical protein EV1_023655 [Malus domestica]